MAVKHAARTCPKCQYGLVTCVGPYDADVLTGVCVSCGTPMTIDVSTGAQGQPVDAEPHTIAVTDAPPTTLPADTVYAPLVQPKPPAAPIAEQGPKPSTVPDPPGSGLELPAPSWPRSVENP